MEYLNKENKSNKKTHIIGKLLPPMFALSIRLTYFQTTRGYYSCPCFYGYVSCL